MSGEIHASVKSALVDSSRYARNAANDRLRSAFGQAGASSAPVMAYGANGGLQMAPANSNGVAGWTQAYGSWGSLDGDQDTGASKLNRSDSGIFIGADANIAGNWRAGVMAGYGNSSLKANQRASSADVDSYAVGAYAGTQAGRLGVRLGAAQTWHDIKSRRSIDVPGLEGTATASYRARTAQVFGEAGYTLQAGVVSVEPFAELAYVNQRTQGYGESGPAGLHGEKDSDGTTFSTLGARASGTMQLGRAQALLHGTLGWRHAYGDETPLATHAFTDGGDFTVAGTPIARNVALLEAGFDLQVGRNTTMGVSYQGQIGDGARQHGVTAKIDVQS